MVGSNRFITIYLPEEKKTSIYVLFPYPWPPCHLATLGLPQLLQLLLYS
jgi:hypothetical protein